MYQTILIPVEHSASDETMIAHIKQLARLTGGTLILIHVASGWAARNQDQLNLVESEEIQDDRSYLEELTQALTAEGFTAKYFLAAGEPSDEIIKCARQNKVDLIAMSTHGHRLIGDIIYGSTVHKVRHSVDIPVLLLKAKTLSVPK